MRHGVCGIVMAGCAHFVLIGGLVILLGGCSEDATKPPDENPPHWPETYERTAIFTTPAFSGGVDCKPGDTPILLSHVEIWVQELDNPNRIDYLLTQSEPVTTGGGVQETVDITLPVDQRVNVRVRLVTTDGALGCWSDALASGS